MNPAAKRFQREFLPIADAIASLDINQVDREHVARAVAGALDGRRDFILRQIMRQAMTSEELAEATDGA